MGLLRNLAGQTALYGVSSILGRMVNYLLLPLHTALLEVGEFGVVTEFYIYTAFLLVVYTFGMETTYFRLATRPEADASEALHITQSIIIAISVVVSSLIFLGSGLLAAYIVTPLGAGFFKWMAIILLLDALGALPFARLRLERKAALFAGYKILMIVANLLLNVVFLWALPGLISIWGSKQFAAQYMQVSAVEWILLANLLSSALIFVLFRDYFAKLKWLWSSQESVKALKYGMPIMLMGVAGMINELFGRLMLKYFLPEGFYRGWSNQEILGIYGGCYKLSIFLSLAIQSFRYAAEPFFFSRSTEQGATKDFARIMLWFVIVCSFIFVAISFNLQWISAIFLRKKAYQLALSTVPLLLLGNLFLGMYYNFSVWFKLTDRTIYGSYISWGGMLATILLNWLLIPRAGFMGSAFATMLVYLGMSASCYYLGQRYYPIPYPMRRIIFYLVLALVLVTIDHWWLQQLTALSILFKCILGIIFISVVVWLERLEPLKWLQSRIS